jgi:hypothetical protein
MMKDAPEQLASEVVLRVKVRSLMTIDAMLPGMLPNGKAISA